MDRRAFRATVHGVTKSWTQLKWLSMNFFIRIPMWLSCKDSTCQCRRWGLIPGLGRSPGEGSGNPLQSSCLRNPMDRGAWQAIDHVLAKSQMWLSMYILLYWAWKGDCLYSQEFISRFHMFLMGIFQGQSLVVSTTTPSMDCSLSLYF